MSASTFMNRAIAAHQVGRFDEVYAYCEAVLHGQPTLEMALALRALALHELGRHADAMVAARECLQHHPENRAVRQLLEKPVTKATPRAQQEWAVDTVIQDRWEIFGKRIGGMGIVYFVRDREWGGMELAIKSLKPDASDLERKMFRRETRVWLDLGGHPQIVSGYYTVEIEKQPRFFMEFVRGTSLSELLESGSLPVERVLDFAIQIAAGMLYVHGKGIEHRDLKPHNCLVGADDIVKITDFGLGRSMSMAAGAYVHSLTDTSRLDSYGPAGTPLYMAPEQWRSLGEAGQPVDVYAFGVMLYELLAGEAPYFPSEGWIERNARLQPPWLREVLADCFPRGPISPNRVLESLHSAGAFAPLRSRGVQVPGPLDVLVARCLAKEPAQRPTFVRLLRDLVDIYELATGAAYTRELVRGNEPTEAGESNRALSYHMMGKVQHAKEILDGWLAKDPAAAYARINRSIMDIETGEHTPAELAHLLHHELSTQIAKAHDPTIGVLEQRLAPWLLRGTGAVTAVATTDDVVGVGYVSGAIALWDAATGQLRHELEPHRHRVSSLAFVDGQLFSASWDRSVRRYDLATGSCVMYAGAASWVLAIAVGATTVLAGTADGKLHVWDRRTTRGLHAIPAHEDAIEHVLWVGEDLVTAARDGAIRRWRIDRDGTPVQLDRVETTGAIASITALADGSLLVASHEGHLMVRRRGAIVWKQQLGARPLAVREHRGRIVVVEQGGSAISLDVGSGEITARSPTKQPATAAAIGADVAWLGREDGCVWRLDIDTAKKPPKIPFVFRRPRAAGEHAAIERERSRLAERVEAGDVDAFRELDRLRLRTPELSHAPSVLEVLARAGSRHGIRRGVREVWSTWQTVCGGSITAIELADDDRAVWIGTRSGEARLLELGTGRALWSGTVPNAGQRPVSAIAATADGAVLATADGNVSSLVDGELRWTTKALSKAPRGMVRADDHLVVVGAEELVAIRASNGSISARTSSAREIGPVVISSNEIATVGKEGIRFWNAASLAPLRQLPLAARAVALDVSARGFFVRTAEAIQLLAPDGTVLAAWSAPSAIAATSATIDGRLVASGSRDFNDTRLYLHGSHDGTRELEHHAAVQEVRFTRDGLSLISGDVRGVVRSWTLDVQWCLGEELLAQAEALVGGSSELWPAPQTRAHAIAELERIAVWTPRVRAWIDHVGRGASR